MWCITGASGFVGRALLRRLGDKAAPFRRGDWPISRKFDVIINCAGERSQERDMLDANVMYLSDLLTASHEIPYRAFIHIGSSSEYGRCSGPISESEPLKPTTMYEGTKAAGSMLAIGYAKQYKKPIAVARPFSLYGPGDDPRKFIPTLIRAAKGDRKIKLAPGVHDWLYIDDFVDGLIAMVKKGFEPGEVVNFGTGYEFTNYGVMLCVQDLMGGLFNIERVDKMHSYDSMSWVCDPSYSKSRYGWEASTPFDDGLKKTIEGTT